VKPARIQSSSPDDRLNSASHRHNAGTSSDEKDVEQANENAAPQGERKLFAFTQEALKKTCFRRIPSRIGNGK
jgi:hypothetical protein